MPDSRAPLVLVVDDEVQDIERISGVLERFNVDIQVSTRAFEAKAFLAAGANPGRTTWPSLVLLDWRLPGDGESVLKTIRSTETVRSTPVVVLSRSNAAEDVRAAYAGHANAYVVKPPNFADYEFRVSRACEFFLRVSERPPMVYLES